MKNKIVLVAAGKDFSAKKLRQYTKECNYLIAVDGGLNTIDNLNLNPNLIMGDMDSTDTHLLKKYSDIPLEIFSKDKDFTDMELAIKKAISMNPLSIVIFAGTGSYLDHSLANIYLLKKYSLDNLQIEIITSNSKIFIIKKNIILRGTKGRRFSLFPLSDIKNVSLTGAMYNFKNNDLSLSDYSISNVVVHNTLKINFSEGSFLCILFDDGYC